MSKAAELSAASESSTIADLARRVLSFRADRLPQPRTGLRVEPAIQWVWSAQAWRGGIGRAAEPTVALAGINYVIMLLPTRRQGANRLVDTPFAKPRPA